eukprot:5821167-Prymnesium_polylepis.1
MHERVIRVVASVCQRRRCDPRDLTFYSCKSARARNGTCRIFAIGRKGETTKFKGAKREPSKAAKKKRKRKKRRDREDEKVGRPDAGGWRVR